MGFHRKPHTPRRKSHCRNTSVRGVQAYRKFPDRVRVPKKRAPDKG